MAYQPSIDLPSPDFPGFKWGEAAAYHTPERLYIYPGRRVLQLPGISWSFTPGDCQGTDEYGTQWYVDDMVLVCQGCGLDVS